MCRKSRETGTRVDASMHFDATLAVAYQLQMQVSISMISVRQ